MNRSRTVRTAAVAAALALGLAACGDDEDDSADTSTEDTVADETGGESTDDTMDESMDTEDTTEGEDATGDTSTICDADALVEAVESGPEDGTLEGMVDAPVGTAASSNPVLTTLVETVTAADLVDTLNSAPELTVFAPTDCAFAAADPATIEAALADPTGLLTQVLGFHVIPERLEAADLAGLTEVTTFTDAVLPISAEGETISLNGGQATVVVPDIQTANATVHLIDNVMVPEG